MHKQHLTYLLGQLTMTVAEFAAESHIAPAQLESPEPSAATARAVAGYFSARNQPQEKRVIREILCREKSRLCINDANIFDALEDYLSYSPLFSRHGCAPGADACVQALYPADCLIFQGKGPILHALSLFDSRAVVLYPLQPSVILYSPALLNQSRFGAEIMRWLSGSSVHTVPSEFPFPLSLPEKLLIGILPGHCLLEVYAREKPIAIFTQDAAKANSAWLYFYGSAAPGSCAAGFFCFRLAYVLDLAAMPNDALAELLYIDKTLVSKWKNGKRKLNCYDEALHQLAAALYRSGPKAQNKLRRLLSAYFPLAPDSGEGQVVSCLCKWLSYREEARSHPAAPFGAAKRLRYHVYLGLHGLWDAVQDLLRRCQQIPTPFRLCLTCFDPPDCLSRLDSMLLELLQKLPHCHFTLTFKSGSMLCQFAQTLLRSVQGAELDRALTSLLLRGGLTVQCRPLSPDAGCCFLAVVPDIMAVEAVQAAGVPDQLCTRSYLEPDAVQMLCKTAAPPAAERPRTL